jgi:predicted nucleic-acid-binding protein
VAQAALEATCKGGAGGFADHLIAHVGFANGCREALTFDRLLGPGDKVRRVPWGRRRRTESQ